MLRSFLALTFAVILGSCLQTENSNTQDESNYGGDGSGSVEFRAVKQLFSQNCVPCHSYHTQTEAELKADTHQLLVPGSPDTSNLYCRLSGAAGTCATGGAKNMPQGAGALSSSDLQAVRFWIINAPP